MEEFLGERLRPMYRIIELKIPELPQKLELVLLKDKNSKQLTIMKKSKMELTTYIIKIRTKITRKMDIFIKKE
jgi:hypothetical protein